MPEADHNVAAERDHLYSQFLKHHEATINLGRQSVESAIRAGQSLLTIRETFPARSGWEEWWGARGLAKATVSRYLLLGGHKFHDDTYDTIGDAVQAARDARDEARIAGAREAAEKARQKARTTFTPDAHDKLVREAERHEGRLAKYEARKARREQARATLAEPDAPQEEAQAPPDTDWRTPSAVLSRAREVMGTIHLDPASSLEANASVRAHVFFTPEVDGLAQQWSGRNVWLCPPHTPPKDTPREAWLERWLSKLDEAMKLGHVQQAIVLLTNADTASETIQSATRSADAICLWSGRMAGTEGDGHGQVLLYHGDLPYRFAEVFQERGTVLEPIKGYEEEGE